MKKFLTILLVVLVASCSKDKGLKENIFLGDSHIERWNFSYFFPFAAFQNMGKGGAVIKDAVKSINDSHGNQQCFIETGTNDIRIAISKNTSQPEIIINVLADYKSLLDSATTKFEKIYVIEIIPVSQFFLSGSSSLYILINSRIKDLCASYNNVQFIAVYDVLANHVNYLEASYTQDGLHLNTKGYEIISTKIRKFLY